MKKHKRLFSLLMIFSIFGILALPDSDNESSIRHKKFVRFELPADPSDIVKDTQYTDQESQHTVDSMGLNWENRLTYNNKDLVRDENFREGQQYGLQKFYQNSKLYKLQWIYGTSSKNSIYIIYKHGEISQIKCKQGFKVENDQLNDACGFGKQITHKLQGPIFRSDDTYLDGEIIASTNYHQNGSVWIQRYKKNGYEYENVFSQNGKLFSESIRNLSDRSSVEKIYFSKSLTEVRKTTHGNATTKGFITLLVNNNFAAEWDYEFGHHTNGKVVCTLRRSIASVEKLRPSTCPKN